ncbi:MAG: lysoplasmalogenase [Candidatus Heimdallarchaeota archaeon]|nr:lysoplasmalogenase [Candidatus Heimdallarchaeota archaeon]MCK4876334.1 lysoplasmalogenase [Candidatus Heimdallarchaeota archaeon]
MVAVYFEWIMICLFFIVAIIHILGEYLLERKTISSFKIRYATKPLLMPILVILYLVYNPNISWWIVLALIGGFLGDVFLMLPDSDKTKKWLKVGLISFLFGHIFYIVAFSIYVYKFPFFKWWILFLIIPFVVAAVILMPIITKSAGKMAVPVVVYIIIICFMSVNTAFLIIPVENYPIGWEALYMGGIITIYIGAWFFGISDTLNGYGKFVKQFKNERVYTMSTYILGQFLLVFGYLLITTTVIYPSGL